MDSFKPYPVAHQISQAADVVTVQARAFQRWHLGRQESVSEGLKDRLYNVIYWSAPNHKHAKIV